MSTYPPASAAIITAAGQVPATADAITDPTLGDVTIVVTPEPGTGDVLPSEQPLERLLDATAFDRPCQLYRYHQPVPSRTQGHHVHPVYLQNRVFGQIRDNQLLWVCGTCHDNIHEWLMYLLGEARKPNPEPGRHAKTAAEASLTWFMSVGGVLDPTAPAARRLTAR